MLEERTRKIERQKDRETEREAFSTNFGVKKEQDRQTDRKTERQKDRKTERQKDRKTERQKDRKKDR